MSDTGGAVELETLPGCIGEAKALKVPNIAEDHGFDDDEGYGAESVDDLPGYQLTEEELADAQAVVGKIDKSNDSKRWLVLVLATLAIFGPYYVFDNPAGTQQTLKEHFGVPLVLNESTSASQNATAARFNLDFNLLYTLYSLPNTVLPLVGGVLVDMFGFRKMTVATVTMSALGQLGFAIFAKLKYWPGMWASRAVFGIGTESLCVAQRILVAEWFLGRELALAMGVVLAFGRLGSTVNDNISALFDYCVTAYWVGFALCVVSVVSAVAVTWIDYRHENAVRTKVTPKQWHAFERSRKFRPRTQLSDVCRMGLPFWLCCGMVLFCFPPVSSFNNISSQLISARWGEDGHPVSIQQVNAVVGILYAVSAVLALGMGWVVDRAGTRTVFVMLGSLIVAGSHCLIAFTDVTVAVPMVGIGVGFSSLAAAVWPEIAFVTPRESFGVAYGVAGAVQNSGLASVPAIVSQLQPPACSGEYECVELLFSGIAVTGAAFALVAACLEWTRRRLEAEAKAMGAAEALLDDVDADEGWGIEDEGEGVEDALDDAQVLPTAQRSAAMVDTAPFRNGRDRSAPTGRRKTLGARMPRRREQSALAGRRASAAVSRHGHRAVGLTGRNNALGTSTRQRGSTLLGMEDSTQSLGFFLTHASHHPSAHSSTALPSMDAMAAATAAGRSEREPSSGPTSREDGSSNAPRPNTPEMVSAAIWGYAADLAQHGTALAERHYVPPARQSPLEEEDEHDVTDPLVGFSE